MTRKLLWRRILLAVCALCLFAAPGFAEGEGDDLASINSASIVLSGDAITFEGYGVGVEGSVVTITMPGVYTISGMLDDGQIVVDCSMDEKVELLLNGATVFCADSAPIYIRRSERRTTIRLAEGTENRLSCGEIPEGEIDGAVYSKGDLTITGEGALTIESANADGIVSKDDLRIKGGVISVVTPGDGVRGKDSVEIYDGKLTVVAGGDGIKSTNTKDAGRGFIEISGGDMYITYGDEVLQAVSGISITGGTLHANYVPAEE